MDWGAVGRLWENWVLHNVGSSGRPLKAALLINYDQAGPSRLLSTILVYCCTNGYAVVYLIKRAEQEGIKADPIEVSQFLSFVTRNKLQMGSFFIGRNQYLVTSIHESWFCARCLNTTKQAGEGAIVMQTSAFLLVGIYEGSIGPASRAMAAVDQFSGQLTRRNL
ncbi:profilin family protein [Striga asiatica]|uniref:Profilin family protein n=1 Tax=Striga asiatica TaxID=4170 RepID=A0A5A7PC58_STRAF|nr:profilin family protein [Striga asiatica]